MSESSEVSAELVKQLLNERKADRRELLKDRRELRRDLKDKLVN